jgi:hypothetical protein
MSVFDSFKNTVEAITEAGLRDKVKIMIGVVVPSPMTCANTRALMPTAKMLWLR